MKTPESKHSVSYYDVLQVSQASSDTDVRAAYYRLAKRFHPDRNPQERRMNELRFRLINEAYAHLKTTDKRMQYNRILKQDKKTLRSVKKQTSNDNKRAPGTSGNWFSRARGWLGLNNAERRG